MSERKRETGLLFLWERCRSLTTPWSLVLSFLPELNVMNSRRTEEEIKRRTFLFFFLRLWLFLFKDRPVIYSFLTLCLWGGVFTRQLICHWICVHAQPFFLFLRFWASSGFYEPARTCPTLELNTHKKDWIFSPTFFLSCLFVLVARLHSVNDLLKLLKRFVSIFRRYEPLACAARQAQPSSALYLGREREQQLPTK